MLKLLYVLACAFLDRDLSRPRRGKSPQDFTLDEVRALPPGHPALIGIALNHSDENTACEAAERLTDRDQLRVLVYMQEALVAPRMIALRLLETDEKLMLEMALNRETPPLAMFAAHRVRNRFLVRRLQQSFYPSVRLIGLMKENDPVELERLLKKESDPEVRECAAKRLFALRAS